MGPFDMDFAAREVQGGLALGLGPQALHLGGANGSISMCADTYGALGAAGGTQSLRLDAGVAHAGKIYFILGSISGHQPGIPLAPGVVLPLNIDEYFLISLTPNILVVPSVGMLDAQGRAAATFTLPPGLAPAGTIINHAALVLDASPFAFASTPATFVVR
jgi:hypothetical protein